MFECRGVAGKWVIIFSPRISYYRSYRTTVGSLTVLFLVVRRAFTSKNI